MRLWLGLFAAGFVAVGALLALSFCTPAPYGDLTRIGGLSETHFGWRDEQPVIDPEQLTSAPIDQADILVVGDSFSVSAGPPPYEGLLWQSRLVAAGWRVASLHWDQTHPLCPDFHEWLSQTGFRGRWVLLESIERALDDRLTHTRPCGSGQRPKPQPFAAVAARTHPPAPALNLHEKLLTGIITMYNTRQALAAPNPMVAKDPSASNSVRMQPWSAGCQHFSHRACDRALFLLDDEQKPSFDARHLPLMAAAQTKAQPWRLAWVVVPNKRTYYVTPDAFATTSQAGQRQGLGPDVMGALQAQSTTLRDLYFPNDTHLSPRGSLVLGEAVKQWLERQPR